MVDEQQKTVNAETEKIGKEEADTKIIADEAQAILGVGLGDGLVVRVRVRG